MNDLGVFCSQTKLFFIRLLLIVLCLSTMTKTTQAVEKPNILLILVDDVGWDAVGCYGGESYPTPNVDRLAFEGMRLTNFHVSPVCHPTRVGLMTGRYLWSNGNPKWGYFNKGEAEQTILAHRLKQLGYATAAAGKWHLAKFDEDPQQPHRCGFDEFCFFGWHEGPRYWDPHIWQNGERLKTNKSDYGPDIYTDFLIDFIKRNQDGPFFAYYPMALSHAVSDDFKPRPPHGPKGRYHTFAEMMAEMDKYVGKMIDAIDDLGLREETLIVFLTDNGTTPSNFIRHEGDKLIRDETTYSMHNGKMIKGGKGQFTDWGTRVPAILSWSGKIEGGTGSALLSDVTDVAPTLLELASGDASSDQFDGRSFAGLVTGEDVAPREWISTQTRSAVAVRTRDWKLLSDATLSRVGDDPHTELIIKQETDESKIARERLTGYLNTVRQLAPAGSKVP